MRERKVDNLFYILNLEPKTHHSELVNKASAKQMRWNEWFQVTRSLTVFSYLISQQVEKHEIVLSET